jgi:hypothetical protein
MLYVRTPYIKENMAGKVEIDGVEAPSLNPGPLGSTDQIAAYSRQSDPSPSPLKLIA